ncbi:MAG: hypothetical protein ACR2G5_02920 [Pyrinomonadaceae bacterium]
MTDYLTVVEVLTMHADQIERYGGSQGVRDHGLLEAALYETNQFSFDKLTLWLRSHVTDEPPAK